MSNSLSISHFIDDYSLSGGTERVASNLTNLFTKNGHNVPAIFSFTPINIVPFYDYGKEVKFISFAKNDDKILEKINSKLIEFSIDVIIFHGYHTLFFNNHFSNIRLLSAKIILITHYSTQNFLSINPKLPIYKNLLFNISKYLRFYFVDKKKYKRKIINILEFGKIVCVSERCTNELIHYIGINSPYSKNIFTIHNPLLITPPSFENNKKEKVVIYAGSLREKKKNSMLIINAWEEIYKFCPQWSLWIIGEGELKSEMVSYVYLNKIRNVVFLGLKRNIEDYFNKSQIITCTSNSEGLPQVLVEACFLKNVIISTSFDGGYKEIVENGVNGIVVQKNNHKLFGKYLLNLINNEELRTKMLSQSNSILDKFRDSIIIEKWNNLLFSAAKHSK
jgi:glycosyltransferase involved in cell wall biosynthesis